MKAKCTSRGHPNVYIEMSDYYLLLIKYKDIILPARIDKDDYNLVSKYKWHTNKRGDKRLDPAYYVEARYKNKTISLHRLIMKTPKGLVVDHINRNPLDNRKVNLRNCTLNINAGNRTFRIKTSQVNKNTGIKYLYICRNCYYVRIHGTNKNIYFGKNKQKAIKYLKEKGEYYESDMYCLP